MKFRFFIMIRIDLKGFIWIQIGYENETPFLKIPWPSFSLHHRHPS